MRHRSGYKALAVIFAALLWAPEAGAQVHVTLKPGARTSGPFIILADVGDVSGEKTAVGKAEAILLGRAPAPGQERTITMDRVELRLVQEGFSTKEYTIDGAEATAVRSEAPGENRPAPTAQAAPVGPAVQAPGERDREAVVKACNDYLSRRMGGVEGVELGLTLRQIRRREALPAQGVGADVGYNVIGTAGSSLIGPVRFELEALSDGKRVSTMEATLDVAVTLPVCVPVRPIGRGQIIGREDVAAVATRFERDPGDVVVDPQKAVGLRARGALAVGRPIPAAGLDAPALVDKGDPVRVVAGSRGVTIELRGRAEQTGAMGDIVVVRNLRSGLEFQARVVGSATVAVE